MTLDASVALEKRLTAEAGADDNAFVTSAFAHLLGRPPKGDELRLSTAFLQKEGRDGTRLRQQFLGALFNHNDFITLR